MALKVTKADMWAASIDDRRGGAAEKIEPLSAAGADFQFVLARRTPESPGKGLVIVTPVKGAKVTKAAGAAGFVRATDLHGLRIEGAGKPGLGAKIMRALGDAGISFRGFSGASLGRQFVAYLALDNAQDAARAAAAIKKVG